uniref:EF-hand family protein n=1 Tax=Coptotermes formosanus TaxID=36987 RepID=R4UJV9_COPFO|nr:EF-hand family protein [Coptotermes formosanus]
MSEEDIALYSQKFDEHDKDKSGFISPKEFVTLYRDIENDQNKTEEESKILFDGIDIDGNGKMSKDEFLGLVKTVKTSDKLALFKIAFRAFDKDRSRSLEAKEVVEYSKFCKAPVTKEEAEKIILEKNPDGKTKGLNFPQLYKIVAGEDIDELTDPYDGREVKKSGCCLLF